MRARLALIWLVLASSLMAPPLVLHFAGLITLRTTTTCAISSLDRLEDSGGYGREYAKLAGPAKSYLVHAETALGVLSPVVITVAALCAVVLSLSGVPSKSANRLNRLARWLLCILAFTLIIIYGAVGSLRLIVETPLLKPDLEDLKDLCECVGPPISMCANQETPVMHLAWIAHQATSSDDDGAALVAASQYANFVASCACLLSLRDDVIAVTSFSFVALVALALTLVVDRLMMRWLHRRPVSPEPVGTNALDPEPTIAPRASQHLEDKGRAAALRAAELHASNMVPGILTSVEVLG